MSTINNLIPEPARDPLEQLSFTGHAMRYPNLPIALDGLGIGHLQEHVDRPSGIEPWQWIQCVHGQGQIHLNQKTYIVREGCGFLLPPNYPHIYYGITNPWYVNFLCFNGSAIASVMESLGLTQPGVYQLTSPKRILDYEAQIYDICQQQPVNGAPEISKILYALLVDLASDISETTAGPKSGQNDKVHAAICYLYDHFAQPISLSDTAAAVNLSKEYLCQLFRETQDLTILEYLTEIRISNAKTFLIKYPEKNLAEIAAMCGFETSSYFCAVFKKREHMTPGQFRKSRK